jgi:hypothetical protein
MQRKMRQPKNTGKLKNAMDGMEWKLYAGNTDPNWIHKSGIF